MSDKADKTDKTEDTATKEFSGALVEALENTNISSLELATEFNVDEIAVACWQTGFSYPHPRIQKLVLAYLEDKKNHA